MAIPKLIHYQDNSYITGQGTLLEGFETFADWTISGTGATGSGDSTHRKQGIQSLRLNSVNGEVCWGQKTISEDFSAVTNFILWIYVDDEIALDNFSHIAIRFSSTSDWSKFFYVDLTGNYYKHGWNRFVFHKGAFSNSEADSWSNTMIRMRVGCLAKAGKNASASFDDLRYDHAGKAKCILCFDDTHASAYDKAKPIMDANSLQKGVAFVVTDDIGGVGSLTTAQLTTMQTAGWDISNHSKEHWDLPGVTEISMEKQIDDAYDWLVNNGFGEGARFFAYPFGTYNQAVIAKVRERHRIARSDIDSRFQPHFNLNDNDIEFLVKATVVTASDAPATVNGWIDDAIAQGGLLILIFHNIVDSGATGLNYNKADFETIADYLYIKEADEDIDVITFSTYYDQFIPSLPIGECPPYDKYNIVYLRNAAIVPYPIVYEPSESIGRSEDKRLKVYKHPLAGDRKRIWRIKCIIDNSGDSCYKWRDLEYFYSKVVEGALRRCVFVDANSVQYLVRIIGFAQRVIAAKNKHEVTMILEEDYI